MPNEDIFSISRLKEIKLEFYSSKANQRIEIARNS
jgi:hypothetical protein